MDSKYPNSNEFLLKEAEGPYFARNPKFVYVKWPHATDIITGCLVLKHGNLNGSEG